MSGEGQIVEADGGNEARELARLLIAAADACDAYDKPDTDDDGKWWFPDTQPQGTATAVPPKDSPRQSPMSERWGGLGEGAQGREEQENLGGLGSAESCGKGEKA